MYVPLNLTGIYQNGIITKQLVINPFGTIEKSEVHEPLRLRFPIDKKREITGETHIMSALYM